ncbi:MAG: sugar phosphate isomerase/epimerase [Verrucomicrobiota bacterium]|jgi:sugar phosphate isomerase/epimerase
MSRFTRREFIGAATAASAALMAGPFSVLAAARKKLPVGVQLYSVRDDFSKDVPGVLAGIKKIGYEGVEFAGYANYANNAAGLRKLLDDNGLKACGSHIQGGLPTLQGDGFARETEFNKVIGNDKLIIASGNARSVDDWTRFADSFSAIAEKLKPLQMRIGYHNHTAEFTPVDGQVPEYIFFDKASPDVFVQLDIGHCAHAGGDPVAVIKKYSNRLVSLHVKDWEPATRSDIVGEGIVKWADVLEACASSPTLQWYNIEEESGKFPGLEGIDKDYKNFTKLLAG